MNTLNTLKQGFYFQKKKNQFLLFVLINIPCPQRSGPVKVSGGLGVREGEGLKWRLQFERRFLFRIFINSNRNEECYCYNSSSLISALELDALRLGLSVIVNLCSRVLKRWGSPSGGVTKDLVAQVQGSSSSRVLKCPYPQMARSSSALDLKYSGLQVLGSSSARMFKCPVPQVPGFLSAPSLKCLVPQVARPSSAGFTKCRVEQVTGSSSARHLKWRGHQVPGYSSSTYAFKCQRHQVCGSSSARFLKYPVH